MKYVVIKEKMSLSGAMKYLYDGYFIRRSCWNNGSVIFTKEDYQRTQFAGLRHPEYDNIEAMLAENPASVPQFWFCLGSKNNKITPEDVYARDWVVVQCKSMTDNEAQRTKGKLGGIKKICKDDDVDEKQTRHTKK